MIRRLNMNTIKKISLICFFLVIYIFPGKISAQTTLSTGDVSIVGWNSSTTPDGFSFVTWVNLTSGTVIKFTNNGFLSSSSATTASNARVQQQIIYWTATSAVAAGTVISIDASASPTASTGSVSYSSQSQGTQLALSNTGGRLFIYQGSSDYASAPTSTGTFLGTILYGLNYQGATGSATWLTSGTTGSTTTYLPSELSSSSLNITFGSNANSGEYTGSRSSQSSFAAYKTMVQSTSNWTTTTGTGTTTLSTTAFTLASTNYYYKGTGTITTLTNWGTNTDGTGSNPSSFTESGATYFVANTSGTVNLSANWTVGSSTGTLNIGSGIILGINGNTLDVTGAIAGSGTLAGSSTSNLSLTGTVGTINFTTGTSNRTLRNLTLGASTTATLGTAISITGGSSAGTVTVGSSSTLTTGGNLTLSSDANGTARIGNSSGSISGNVIVNRYIPGGRRAYRFFAHPFTSAHALNELTGVIDITGSGGATNGFTTTGTNNPSSYWYDVSTANGSSSNDIGWTAFTNTNGSGANSWDQYEGIRILVRGASGEGLTSAAYTPSAVTLNMTGAINQGSQAISVTKGSSTTYALVGNPFPSPISMDGASKTAGIGSNFYIWSAQQGTKGGYTTYTYGSSSFNLPIMGAFVTQISSNGTITFDEADKTSSTSTMFKTSAFPNRVTLNIEDSTIYWDRLQLHYDDNALAVSEVDDAQKFPNPEVSFNTYSADDSSLAIDNRPYLENEIIKLGFTTPYQKNYKIVVADFDIPAGTKLYLKDNYTSKNEEITAGYEYWFSVDANAASQGKNRFELNAQGKPTNSIANTGNSSSAIQMLLSPNPANETVNVHYISGVNDLITIHLLDMTGKVIYEEKQKSRGEGNIKMNLKGIPSGVYIVELKSGIQSVKQKLVKQ